MTETGITDGQSGEGLQATETTGAETGGEGGESVGGDQTTQAGTESSPESFFDPQNIPEELQQPYKEMQAAFTKRMQGFKDNQSKIEAYDAFQSNPQGYLQQLASQYGMNLVGGEQPAGEKQPETWDEVMEMAEKRVMQKLSPQMQKLQQTQLEKTLDDISPDWRLHEDSMMKNLNAHPTLANNPEMLYRMSVPPEVLESRATQAALKKLQEKGQSAQVSGGSQTSRNQTTAKEATSFQEAVDIAKARLNSQGLAP